MATGRELRISIDGHEYRLAPGQEVTVGRHPSAAIVVHSGDVSRHHLRIYDSPSGWALEDTDSTYGTWIGDKRVEWWTIVGPVRVRLGRPAAGVVMALTPLPVTHPPPPLSQADGHPPTPLLPLTALVLGILLIVVGVFALDWYKADIAVEGPLQTQTTASKGLDLDAGGLGLAAGAIGGVVGILRVRSSDSTQPFGLLVVLASMITAATTLYLMFGPPADDESVVVPGITATADVSPDVGGYVTLAGAIAVGVGGIALLLVPSRSGT
jgi:hypothetical protein